MTLCERCNDGTTPATTHQEYRDWDASDPRYRHWKDNATDRCDRCAQALRDYVRLPQISTIITVDRPLKVRVNA